MGDLPHVVFLAAEPLWERAFVSALGPLVTVLVGGLIVWSITSRVETARGKLARDDALRHELVTQMTESASSFYLLMQHYRRVSEASEPVPDGADAQAALPGARKKLDAQYLASRATGDAVENRLWGYFDSEAPRHEWHRVQDLLTVRYFQLIDKANDAIYGMNAGKGHTRLSADELRDPDKVQSEYRKAVKSAVHLVFSETLRARS